MPEEVVPAGTAADGNGLVVWVATLADPNAPTSTELNGGVKVTYSLVGDGFRHTATENRIEVSRYTLKQILSLPGTRTDELELQYVTGSPADTTLVPGTNGYLVERLGVANATAFATGQKVDVFPVTCGIKRKVAPTPNSELAKAQTMHIRGAVIDDALVDGDES